MALWFLVEKCAVLCSYLVLRIKCGNSDQGELVYWVSKKYGASVVKELNAACRAGKYREELWQELTDHSVAELGAEWKGSKGQL